jgi:hypothetical protein
MTTLEISAQLEHFSQQLAAAVSERDSQGLAQVLEAQKQFVMDHLGLLDEPAKQRIQNDIENGLLLAKSMRAHCLDAILVNQRKLAVLSAYQGG